MNTAILPTVANLCGGSEIALLPTNIYLEL